MGKYEQKNRTEQTRIHTVGAMVFYSLSTSVIYLYSQIFSRHFTHSLLTLYSEKTLPSFTFEPFTFFHFVTTNIFIVTRCSL